MAPPAIIVGNALLKGTVAASEEWRQYGEVGDRVLSQFRSMYERRSNLEEIYVMGHRLIVFYTEAIPKHKDYRSIDPSISTLREKSINDLDWIRKRLDVISLRIDERQLNLHIQKQQEATSQEKSVAAERGSGTDVIDDQETQWESFSGWSADFASNNDESLRPMDAPEDETDADAAPTTRRRLPLEPDHADDPGDILDLESEEETNSVESDDDSLSDTESDERAAHFSFASEEEDYDSSFLRVIASEEVEYEEDSEAFDSWAQDDESLESLAEHAPVASRPTHTSINYSEAEMLGNLLNRVTQGSSPPYQDEASKVAYSQAVNDCPEDEVENVDPSTSFSSVSKDGTVTTLYSYPSFDEPPDEDAADGITSSPQDVMNFDAHTNCRKSPQTKTDAASFSDEEIVPIYLPGLRI